MATLAEIRSKFPQYADMSDEDLASAIHQKFYPDLDRAEFDRRIGVVDEYSARAKQEAEALKPLTSGRVRASSGGLDAGLMGNFDDEIGAAMTAPFRMAKDRVGPVEAYRREKALNEEIKATQREENPVASIAGQVGGGLALGGKAAQAGLTTAGRFGASTAGRVAGGAVEGAGYGALYGAGDAKEGDRLSGGAEGAAIGGILGGSLGAVSGAMANRSAHAAARKAAPTVGQLADDANALYASMRAEGVDISQSAAQKLASTIKSAAGNPNARLRPNTVGILREVDQATKQSLSLEAFDELRQGVNDALKSAKPGDSRTLMKIKTAMDDFARTMKPGDFTGDARKAVGFLEQAREVYSRQSKTELVESIIDKVDVKSAQFSQSGLANAIRTTMRQVYFNKSILRQFSKPEQALIRQMAKGGSNSNVINLLARFAPRGPVSAAVSTMLGNATMGPAGFVVGPAIGQAAAKSADSAALKALEILRTSAATGGASVPAPQIGRAANVLIPSAVEQGLAIRQ